MEDFALFVQSLAFSYEIVGVSMKRFEVRSDFAQVVAMRRNVQTVPSEFVELLLEGGVLSHQCAMCRRESRQRHRSLGHIEDVTPVEPACRCGPRATSTSIDFTDRADISSLPY